MSALKEEHNGINKAGLRDAFKTHLLNLKTLIPELLSIEVETNERHPEKNFDMVLITTFQSFDDLTVYVNHPDHLKIVKFAK
jgi:hypothetical protein